MPSICGLDPDWQETCDHREGVFLALEVGSVRRTQHHQAAPAVCGVPGQKWSAGPWAKEAGGTHRAGTALAAGACQC
ncbi:C-X-C Chemokine Receptor Type 2 [Manis pentadactyla]|nr:C-X-C Chemokine Receptor Type 2 [Manis pentadactyla]